MDPKAPTGKFECIYQQPMTVPRFSTSTELVVRGSTLPNDYFYKGLSINPIKHFGDSSDEHEDESSLTKLKSIYSEDTMQDPYLDMNFCDNNKIYSKQIDFKPETESNNIFYSTMTEKLRKKKKSLKQSQVFSNFNIFHTIFNQSLEQYPKKCKTIQKLCSSGYNYEKDNSKSVNKHLDTNSGENNDKLKDYVFEASSDILTFIREKEEKYNNNL